MVQFSIFNTFKFELNDKRVLSGEFIEMISVV